MFSNCLAIKSLFYVKSKNNLYPIQSLLSVSSTRQGLAPTMFIKIWQQKLSWVLGTTNTLSMTYFMKFIQSMTRFVRLGCVYEVGWHIFVPQVSASTKIRSTYMREILCLLWGRFVEIRQIKFFKKSWQTSTDRKGRRSNLKGPRSNI